MTIYQDNSVRFIRNSQLKNIELRFSHYRQHAFDKHTHDTYSVGIVKEGQTEFFCHNRTEMIRRGEIALINPGEVHACNPKNGSALTYYMLYIEPNLIQNISFALSEKNARVTEFATPIVCDDLLYRGLTKLSLSIVKAQGDFEVETILYETLAEIIQRYGNIESQKPTRVHRADKNIENGRAYLMAFVTS